MDGKREIDVLNLDQSYPYPDQALGLPAEFFFQMRPRLYIDFLHFCAQAVFDYQVKTSCCHEKPYFPHTLLHNGSLARPDCSTAWAAEMS